MKTNYNERDTDMLKTYFTTMIREIVAEEVNEAVSKKIAAIKLPNEPERPILIDEAAKILKFSRSHIYTLCRTKKIPYVKKGRWLYFYVSELNVWLKEQE